MTKLIAALTTFAMALAVGFAPQPAAAQSPGAKTPHQKMLFSPHVCPSGMVWVPGHFGGSPSHPTQQYVPAHCGKNSLSFKIYPNPNATPTPKPHR